MKKFSPTGVFVYVLGSRSCAAVSTPITARATASKVALRRGRGFMFDLLTSAVRVPA
jgi:hypothetical protein